MSKIAPNQIIVGFQPYLFCGNELVIYYAFYLQLVTTGHLFQRKNKELSQKNPPVGFIETWLQFN